MNWLDRAEVRSDLRYGARMLGRDRGFAAVAIVTIALAIGLATTLFSVFDAVLLRPLPWPHSERLVRLTELHAGATRETPLLITNVTYQSLSSMTTIAALGGWSSSNATVSSGDAAEPVWSAYVTPSLFETLGTPPAAGRVFATDDVAEVVVSSGYAAARFGAAVNAVGRSITVNREPMTIVGVMPAGFAFPDTATRLWRPWRMPPAPRAMTLVNAIARLSDRATPGLAGEEATARARTTSPQINALLAFFGSSAPAQIVVTPALQALTGDVRPGILALAIAAWVLLLMAVANLASLELARATRRYREIAVRCALGAGTRRLLQQLMIEQLLLATAGGALGVGLMMLLHRALPAVLPPDFPRLHDIAVRPEVVGLAISLAVLVAAVLGTIPVLHVRRLQLAHVLREEAGSIGGARRMTRARVWIMTSQVAAASALLVVALLLGRTFAAMISQDRGFTPNQLLTARLSLPDASFTPAARIEAVELLMARIRTLPGAPIAAATTGLPLSGSFNLTGFDMPSVRPPVGASINVHAVRSVVTPGYVRALGLRIAAGRDFEESDDSPSAPKVVLVNRTFARDYLTERAVGDRLQGFMNGDGIAFEVIGIVEDMMRGALTDRVQPEIFSLLRQSPRPSVGQDVIMRTAVAPAQLAQPLRELVRELAPNATIGTVGTMDERIARSLARPRLYALLLGGFAAAALIVAAVGLVGVLSYTVSQRTREIALRMALGAAPRQIAGLVLSQALRVTLSGVAVGLLAAGLAVRFLASLVYGVSTYDPVSFVAAPALLVLLALAACAAPSIRAVRVETLTNLRG